MPKRLNVELGFTADTSQAKKQIADLQKSLDSLMSISVKDNAFKGFDKDIAQAQESVLKLKAAIDNSLNADTGRLDLSKFNTQLNTSGLSLNKLATDMRAMGADGQKAFLNLANSIVTAQKPMAETNKLLDGMWTALKNTARWQLSSSMLHGFMSAISGAYGYAQNLNESLNNIRIVTGLSADEMAVFADQANKSAQALSASTLAYTDAALIYYQQGIRDQDEINSRVETTIKLSNVTGQSAEQVSSYMTAIWNNFYDGSQSLESYADKITALGAATASSSEEIAKGLQQFASLGSSLGLNYDDAVAALATVVAQTRQSASTVGNSFRTLLQRFESLKLGDTLEDGVDLTKYSAALEKVGVQVLDVNGEMRNMSDVIQDLGAKWQTLSQAQRNALAQTVGGVRNANTMIAWMDNFDKFQDNLAIAQGAEGTLQEQADIYAESWEAAQKRVKAAWQAIFQDLIDDKFFITILNGIETILHGIDGLIDALGGLPGVLSGIGVLVTKLFEKQMISGIQKAQQQLKYFKNPFTGKASIAESESRAMGIWLDQEKDKFLPSGDLSDTPEDASVDAMRTRLDLTLELKKVNSQLTEGQREFANSLLETVDSYQKLRVSAAEFLEQQKVNQTKAVNDIKDKLTDAKNNGEFSSEEINNFRKKYINTIGSRANSIVNAEDNSIDTKKYKQLYDEMTQAGSKFGLTAKEIRSVIDSTIEVTKASNDYEKKLQAVNGSVENFKNRLKVLTEQNGGAFQSTEELITAYKKHEEEVEGNIEKIKNEIAIKKQNGQATDEEVNKLNQLQQELKETKVDIENLKKTTQNGLFSQKLGKTLTQAAQGISQLSMGINTLASSWETLNNKDATLLQKFSAVVMGLAMGLPAIASGITALGGAFATFGLAAEGATAANMTFITSLTATPVGWIIAGIAAIAGVFFLLDKAIYSSDERLDDANKKLEESQKALAGAEEAAQKTESAYQNLVETLDGLESKKDAIDQLTEGTLEWKEAIADSNSELLAALEASGQLGKAKLSYEKGGLIQVDNADELKEASRLEALTSQMAVAMSRIAVKESEKDVALAGALDEIRDSYSHAEYQKGNVSSEEYKKYQQTFGKQSDDKLYGNIQEWTKALIDSGYAGEELTPQLIEELIANGDKQLGFLEQIKDNPAIIAAIQAAADQITGADKESDAYKKEVGRMAAEASGYDTSAMSGTALEDFYMGLYDKVSSQANEKWASMDHNEQMKMFAEGSGGKYKWDDASSQLIDAATSEIVEESNIAQSEIELYGKAALTELEAQSMTSQDLMQEQIKALAGTRVDAREKWDTNFGEDSWKTDMADFSDKEYQFALDTDLSQFDSAKEAIEYIKEACKEQHYLELNVNADDLSNYKGKTEDLEAEVQELSNFIQNNTDKFRNLSKHMSECDAIADKFAYSLIRFDDALQDVDKNYEDWSKTLRATNKDILKTEKATKALRKTYANLLDMDGSQLSEDFLQNADNLDLMNEVLHGTEEEAIAAYDKLAKIAAMDIAKGQAAKLSIEFDEDSFNSTWDTIMSEIDRLRLEAGDPIDMAAPEFGPLVNGLNQMLALVGGDVEAAKALFAQLGFQAEFENVPVHKIDHEERTPVTPEFEEKQSGDFFNVTGLESEDGLEFKSVNSGVKAVAYGVKWAAEKASPTKSKSTTNVSSLKIKDGSLHYIGGGSPKITNMPARTLDNGGGGGGGGGCFAAGTPITLNNHYKNIEDIKVGDVVLSYNEKTRKNEYSKVVQTMIHNVYEKIYDLFIKNDKLVVTGNHRFLITRNNEQKWIQAADIQLGDYVLLADGTLYKISKINIQTKFLTVYNFEVSNTHNYYVGENQVLAHNKGGSSKAKKPKIEKPKEKVKSAKEKDRYHNIKEKIEDLNTEMKRLSENKDRAYGKHRIKWMDEEIKKTEEQIKLTDEYIDEIKEYAKTDKEALKEKLKEVGIVGDAFEAQFDENGILKDYEGLLEKLQADFDKTATDVYNKAIEEYNKAVEIWNVADQESEDAKDAWDEAKEAEANAKEEYDKQKQQLDERVKALKQYEETMNLLQEKQQERIDQLNELYDRWLAMTEYKVEINLDINDNDRKLLDWIYNHLGDKADKAADRIANLGQQLKTSQKDIATYVKGIEELFAQNGMNVNLDANNLDGVALGEQLDKMIEKLRADGSEPNIQKVIDDMKEYRDGLMDTYDTMRDVVDEVTENVVNAYDEWNEKLQENLDLMDHYDTVIDTIKEIADLLGEDQLGLGDAQAEAYEASKLKNQQNAAAIAKDNYDAIAAERQKAQEMLDKAESETEKRHWEEVLKNLEESEKEAMEEYLARWRDALRQAEENYQASLERNEKAYQKTMSGGLGTLDKLQEQLDRQKELNNLYLDGYEKYKNLGDLSAKINKNLANNPNVKVQEKMKDLLDDVNAKMEAGAEISEGEATILEKRLALLEAENQLQEARNAKSAVRMTRDNEGNFSYTYTADTSKIEEAQQNYADKFYDLLDYERQYADETQANMLQSWQDFIDKRNDILNDDMLSEEERNKALERLKGDYDELVSYYADELGMVMDEMGRLKTEDWKDMEAILGRLLAAPEDFQTNYQDTVLGKITNAWQNPEDLKDSWVGAVNSLYEADATARNKWIASNEETNRRVDTSTREFADNYVGTLGEVVEASNEVAKSAEEMAQSMGPAMDKVLGEAKDFFSEIGLYMDNLVENIKSIVSAINDLQGVLAGIDPEWQSKILGKLPEGSEKSNMAGYDTGGYTGEWGSSGKLAVLHQKELVLNAFDTSNILKAVDLIRNIPSFGTNVNINHNIDYGSLAAVGATDLQQQVHIDASFPNVQSHTEIELALNNLINSASQYVNRKS